jgi:SSS family solute:Na+ symporter
MTHVWKYAAHPSGNPMGVDGFGLVAGLGFVLAFGYWCTDFLVLQRAMAAKSVNDSRLTPLYAAFPKMLMPFIIVVPGLAAVAISHMGMHYAIPVRDGRPDYDQTIISLMAHYYPQGMVGLGITALLASFMSGMAGNITAFNTVWTYDIYQSYIRRGASDKHYLIVARLASLVCVVLSVATAYLARSYNNIMDVLQLAFGFVNAPLFATFLLGMFWKRATANGAFAGLVTGTVASGLVHGLTEAEGKGGWLFLLHTFPTVMAQNFWIAIFAFSCCFLTTIGVSLLNKPRPLAELHGLVYGATSDRLETPARWIRKPVAVACVAVLVWLALNAIFW